jgi:hypothetical protein
MPLFCGDGHGDALLQEDRSVASGRPMADIAAGKAVAKAVHAAARARRFA